MVFMDKMEDIIRQIEDDGLVIFPSETLWMIGTKLNCAANVNVISKLKAHTSKHPFTIMFSDLKMMKAHLPNLHPRVETLMTHHTKPLTIIDTIWDGIPSFITKNNKTLSFHLVKDAFPSTFINLFGFPILVSTIRKETKEAVTSFDEIPQKYLDCASYICQHGRSEIKSGKPPVVAQYDKRGNLKFDRA